MLKDLRIKNIVLMQSCSIEFKSGMTALTGETGSGKTAVLQGLKLLLGQKLDTSFIRRGEKKGSIEVRFEDVPKTVIAILQEADIDVEDTSLTLYREISVEGKSKCFINDSPASLSLMQKVGSHLVQIVDQSSHAELRVEGKQRELLDLFGSLQEEVAAFADLFETLKEQRLKQREFEEKELQKEREFDFCFTQHKELSSLSINDEEEEELFKEYSLFSSSCEVLQKTEQLCNLLGEGSSSTLATAGRCKSLLGNLSSYHEAFQEPVSLLEESLVSLEEALHLIQKASSLFEITPGRLETLEETLSSIQRIKKKYGTSQAERDKYKAELTRKIAAFETLEEDKQALEGALTQTERKLSLLGKELTSRRKAFAETLSFSLGQELRSLNMPHTEVLILVEAQVRSKTGEDSVCFQLRPNLGEAPTSVKDHASGGELSRLLLALKLCLAEKDDTPTLIFDEIDANVGGKTATMIGEKLLSLSSRRQVICITHFPQVAGFATNRLLVQKNDQDGRTFSVVRVLDKKSAEAELIRMLGNEASKKKITTS